MNTMAVLVSSLQKFIDYNLKINNSYLILYVSKELSTMMEFEKSAGEIARRHDLQSLSYFLEQFAADVKRAKNLSKLLSAHWLSCGTQYTSLTSMIEDIFLHGNYCRFLNDF